MSRSPDERRVPVEQHDPLTWGAAEAAKEPSLKFLRGAALFYGALALVGGFIAHRMATGREDSDWLLGPDPLVSLGVGGLLGVIFVLFSRLLEAARSVRELMSGFAEVLGPLTAGQCFALAIFSSLGEEMIFRGVLQPLLGLVWTSVLFGLCHVPFERRFLTWPLLAILAGFGFGLVADRTGSILAPFVAHAWINGWNLWRISKTVSSTAKA